MKFVFLYRGGPSRQEIDKEYIDAWRLWIEALSRNGNLKGGFPLVPSGKMVSQNEVESFQYPQNEPEELTGYSEIEAASFNEAIKIAKDCPNI